ncbi:MAG: LacI family transcriptional regulator [Gracilibacteraceae bacterium]|nr:LacI family transcriptional regulator [Gracilibacteraceae bacterium]
MNKNRTTIKDVARLAGVSTTTVSRALNGNFTMMTAATRERVEEAIRQLRFVPNAMARGLHQRLTQTVGLLIQDITNPYYPLIVQGVENAARRSGYSLLFANVQRSQQRRSHYLEVMKEKRVDGLIIIGGGIVRDADEEMTVLADVPVVVVGNGGSGFASVQIDNQAAARMAVEHLIMNGHKNIALLTGTKNSITSWQRELGYEEAMLAAGLKAPKKWRLSGGFTYEGAQPAMERLLKAAPEITAVFALNDLMAIGALNALRKSGRRVPEDISVLGFDDIPAAEYVSPSLTTVSIPFRPMGCQAMDMLTELITGQNKKKIKVFPVELSFRNSVILRQ